MANLQLAKHALENGVADDGRGPAAFQPSARDDRTPQVGACSARWALTLAFGLCAFMASTSTAAPRPPLDAERPDIVIRNARVLDGAGNPWIRADVAIRGDRIVGVGQILKRGGREIDATGRYLAPGFIDMMDQSQEILLSHPQAANKLQMGVTTLIAGEGGTPVAAGQLPAYFKRLADQGIGVNFGTYYSAEQARIAVMGDRAGAPSATQLAAMRAHVRLAMEAGAFGVSTALIYPPMSFQGTEELTALAREAGRCHGFYASHIRDESAGLVGAVEEAISIGEQSGAKVEIFHLKAAYQPRFGQLMPKALDAISAARARGVDVAADLYPYVAGGTGLSITAPNWIFADGDQKGWERLRDPAIRIRLKRELAAGSLPQWSNLVEAAGGWDHVVLANAASERFDRFNGASLAQIGQTLKQDPADVAWDIVLEALPRRAMALFFMMDEGDLEAALKRPWVSIGSDAAAAASLGQADDLGLPHPRAYGTFPRVISRYVKGRAVLSLEDAVRKMTSWPAQRMGLADRGLVRPGLKADLVIFDLDALADEASFQSPTAAPRGIETVLVNGRVAFENGRITGVLAGQVLRHTCAGA